jgi:hypothetical protein
MRAFGTANFFMDDTCFEMSKVKPDPRAPDEGLGFSAKVLIWGMIRWMWVDA